MSLRVLALLGCLLACWAKPAAASSDDPHVLVLGRISDDPRHHYEQLKPLLDYIVPRMADLGIRKNERSPQLRFMRAVALENLTRSEEAVRELKQLIIDYP